MKRLTGIGFLVTAVWLFIFGAILANAWSSASQMDLNEWGDFLSGFMAPLALLWLVIGYFLQSQELNVNTAVLKAQQEELRRQVEETAVLAKNSDRQAKAAEKALELSTQERAAYEYNDRLRRRLRLRISGGRNTTAGTAQTQLQNIGEPVTNVVVTDAASDVRIHRGKMIHTDDAVVFSWPAGMPMPMTFSIDYNDSANRRRRERFQITVQNELVSLGENEVTALPV